MDTEIRKSLRLSADLSDRIDRARGREPWGSWVKRQLEAALPEVEEPPAGATLAPVDPVLKEVVPPAPGRGSPSPSLERFKG